ncbi:hypothetical protein [Methanobrevibacter sp. UBA46]|uniref:hypothetical protein n=2 Tax=cellular organisms TaxID=131567 RepID=UPI0039B8DC5D|nr:hypothetical protein [Patescibacteria group bacterium]
MLMKTNSQDVKARLCAIGESNVLSILLQKGWDALNINGTIKNFKSVDIICFKEDLNDWKPLTSFIQVKTSVGKNIPIGFKIEDCLNRDELEKKVLGPYVFVYVQIKNGVYEFRYFILSRSQFIDLANQSHEYYTKGYKRVKEINLDSVAGLNLHWLEGKSDNETLNHRAFNNPLNGISCENKWENIWLE